MNISTHAPLAGRDKFSVALLPTARNFNPRAPCGARPKEAKDLFEEVKISTHAPLAGRDSDGVTVYTVQYISTHAPLAGRDLRP